MGEDFVPVMECKVLSVAEDVFRAKKPGEDPTAPCTGCTWPMPTAGWATCTAASPHAAGDVVRLGLAERDGKLRLAVVG